MYQTLLSNQVGQRVMHDLRSAVYRHLQRLSLAFFTRTRTGEVQSRIASDIGGVQSVVTSTATSIVSNVTTVVASVIAMFILDWRLALLSLGLLPLFVLLTRRVGAQRREITTRRQETIADMSSIVQESLSVSGILLGKTMGRSDALAERFHGESERLADLEVRQRMAGRWVMATIQISFALMPAAVFWFAGQPWLGPAVTIGTVVAFTTLQVRLFRPIMSLLSVQIDVQTSLALFDRIFEYLDLPVDIAERPDAGRPGPRHPARRRGLRRRLVLLRPRAPHPRPRLAGGPRRVDDGRHRRDRLGQDHARLPGGAPLRRGLRQRQHRRRRRARRLASRSLADTVGVVSQETYLLHASVRENIRFARPEATDDEIEEAARAAQIHHVIAALPEGYDTVVGERGHRFSGGERQRIAIARTVLRNPPILVLDEATSALDTETERAVQEALDAPGRGAHGHRHRPPPLHDPRRRPDRAAGPRAG